MVTIEINKTQAKEFAEVIFRDIENYVQKHQEEYNKFLKEESEKQERGEE